MASVIETKINCVKRLVDSGVGATVIREFSDILGASGILPASNPQGCGGFEKFFDTDTLADVLFIRGQIAGVVDKDSRALLMLALSSIVVRVSKMIRRGDLRFAKNNEKKPGDKDVLGLFRQKLEQIIHDLESYGGTIKRFTKKISSDARDLDLVDQIDCVITSPPYLNGTNYIRNTKLELFVNGFVACESDLPNFHSRGIIAGINSISKRNKDIAILPVVQHYIDELAPRAYDNRIVKMVAGYFYDMDRVFEKLSYAMRDGAIFVMDIGDSQFAGVHIPTHDLLSAICGSHGFVKFDEQILRKRRSKNGMDLSQRLLCFRLVKGRPMGDKL